ncbi:MAG TPA: biotin--[acetyl-CoA-carboxylase] ligase [Candidatus Methylomirabilis sp.]|nr:biotin--[acetyl-CoA-carboxylase] ligase [Candidatus Methylomirabilis sp.]
MDPAVITTSPLSIEAIRRRLRATFVGRRLYLFGEVESTNAVARELAHSGAEDGTVVLAEAQRRGRGRRGQPWFSPAGVNLYASALFRGQRLALSQAPVFAFIAGLAVCDAIRQLGLHPAIKWPNDVLVNQKKVAGTLVDCAAQGGEVESLILGVGVNLNVTQTALRAALGEHGIAASSLAAIAGHDVDRSEFAAAYLNQLDSWALRHRAEGAAPVLAAWRDREILGGRRVLVRGDGADLEGRVHGVDEHGRLVVRDVHGDAHVVVTGEVRVLD